jgi:hypothetical protein
MIRKTLIGLAAAAVVTAAAASSASAGVKFYVGAPYFGGYYGGYYGPAYVPACPKVFVGYKTVWNGFGWVQVPRYKHVCNIY